MRITSYEERIMQVKGSIKRLDEVIAHLNKDIEKIRGEMIKTIKIYEKLEIETLNAAETDICKYKLSLMYRKMLDWQIRVTNIGEDFDGMNKTMIEKTISKLQYEHELKELKEMPEGSGDE